ncbi:hypothetical protein HK102_003625, partial [Quaeritorhiza haematococci]
TLNTSTASPAPDYLPTDQDVLRSRVKKTGITETTFHICRPHLREDQVSVKDERVCISLSDHYSEDDEGADGSAEKTGAGTSEQ